MMSKQRRRAIARAARQISESFRRTRLWGVWNDVPENQKSKIIARWLRTSSKVLTDAGTNNLSTTRTIILLAGGIEADIKQRGGFERVWHDLSEAEQKKIRRRLKHVFWDNLYPPQAQAPAQEEGDNHAKESKESLGSNGNGNSDDAVPPGELAGNPASTAALE